MKLAVEFPSISFREGPRGVAALARDIEAIGIDQLDMFDHVVMGFPTESRPAPMYPPKMPILEALMTLSYVAAVTDHIGLGTEVLVLPQRNPTLVAKQISTLDTLSGGRVRLGVGVGWQEPEFEALGEDFASRGRRMDEAIEIMRRFWSDESVDYASDHYRFEAIAMEPKPPQGRRLPVWLGGHAPVALRRVARLADGWLAAALPSDEQAKASRDEIRRHAEDAGRDPDSIEMQMMVASPPTDDAGRQFYSDMDRVATAIRRIHDLGFGWATINMTAIFQAGARSNAAMIDILGNIHDRVRREFGEAGTL